MAGASGVAGELAAGLLPVGVELGDALATVVEKIVTVEP